ncbi:peptide chain release factor N(5)-glutamine methyltransferase [Aquipuribacter hungaricus]|uniref:Peptide chain release factor N(5)-glutamine methyltransferase n=1 Tax=Aquipuribacter hungaricus TaxID=545624 RepID=A0ABV7WFI7_9MICO
MSGQGSLVADLAGAVDRLAAAGVPTPRTDAELLAAHAAGTDRGGLQRLVVMRSAWPEGAQERFADLVAERADRVPLQHLTGRSAFRGLELAVGPGVFLPRPETELLAGLAVAELARLVGADPGARVDEPVAVDLCTGSGAVALAVVDEVPAARVGAVELDPLAHAWAARNVEALGHGRLDLQRGDVAGALHLLPGFVGACHVVTANPPYIPDDLVPVDPEVAEHDPPTALYGGPDGLRVLRVCVSVAARLLLPGGLLVLEHGEPQCDGVAEVLAGAGGWEDVAHHPDLTGRPRLTSARLARG